MSTYLTDDADRMPYGCDTFDTDPYSDYDPMYAGPEDYTFRDSLFDAMPHGFRLHRFEYPELMRCQRNVRTLVWAGVLPEANGRDVIRDSLRADAATYSPARERAAEIFWEHLVDSCPAPPPDMERDEADVWFAANVEPLRRQFEAWAKKVAALPRSPRETVPDYRFW